MSLTIHIEVAAKIRNRCGILLQHSMLLRREDVCNAKLADMFVHSFEESEGKCAVALAVGELVCIWR